MLVVNSAISRSGYFKQTFNSEWPKHNTHANNMHGPATCTFGALRGGGMLASHCSVLIMAELDLSV